MKNVKTYRNTASESERLESTQLKDPLSTHWGPQGPVHLPLINTALWHSFLLFNEYEKRLYTGKYRQNVEPFELFKMAFRCRHVSSSNK
jgi:hypothetical protein